MDDSQVHGTIEQLVAEEHALWEREAAPSGEIRTPANGSAVYTKIRRTSGGTARKKSMSAASRKRRTRERVCIPEATSKPPRRPSGTTRLQSISVIPRPRRMMGKVRTITSRLKNC